MSGFHVEQVPFIGLYRREECEDLLKEEPTDEFSREEGPTIQQYKVRLCCAYQCPRNLVGVLKITTGIHM